MKNFFLPILLFSTLLFGQTLPFNVGEKLSYTLQFNVIKMGRAYLSVEESDTVSGIPSHHVKFVAKTSNFADRIFRVRDKIDIWLNKEDLTTIKIVKQIQEGDYHRNFYTTINYSKSIAVTNNDTIQISEAVRDPYSLLFYLRTVPLEVGKILDFTTFDRKKTTEFQVIVDGKETVQTPAGSFYCKIIRPFREGKSLLKNSGDMIIWFSDDEQCIPVQIKIKLKFGSMLLQLKSIRK